MEHKMANRSQDEHRSDRPLPSQRRRSRSAQFDSGVYWEGKVNRAETACCANAFTGLLIAYGDAEPFSTASVYAYQRIIIPVPADDTDVTVSATVLHHTATVGVWAPPPIAGSSAHIVKVGPYTSGMRPEILNMLLSLSAKACILLIYAILSSEVQFGQRVALIGIEVKQ